MKEEREIMEAKMERLQAKMEQQREEAQAKADAAQAQANTERADIEARLAQLASLPALQSRLESLHASKLLTDEELYRLEDIVADSLEEDEAGGSGGGGQVGKLLALSGRVAGDAALARQLRRKFA